MSLLQSDTEYKQRTLNEYFSSRDPKLFAGFGSISSDRPGSKMKFLILFKTSQCKTKFLQKRTFLTIFLNRKTLIIVYWPVPNTGTRQPAKCWIQIGSGSEVNFKVGSGFENNCRYPVCFSQENDKAKMETLQNYDIWRALFWHFPGLFEFCNSLL